MSISAFNANSAIIDHSSYFTDTSTGLNWLDVTATVNRSYNDIASELGVGGDFDGWRYATKSEFNSLLSSYTGVATVNNARTITTGTTPSVDGLVEYFGSTLDSAWIARFGQTWDSFNGYAEGFGIDFTLGILSESDNNLSNQRKVGAIWDNESNGEASDFYNAEHRQVFVDDARADIGSYLVQAVSNGGGANPAPVTEPRTILLFALGLLGLCLTRNRRHEKVLAK